MDAQNDTAARIRIGVIGLGWVACNRHIPALRRNPAFLLTGLADRDGARAAHLASRLNVPYSAGAQTLAAIDWLDQIDALVIAAPPAAHHDLALAALESGKHVLSEKPLVLSDLEAASLAEAAERSGKILAAVHNFQFSRAMRKLETDLQKGRLGKIRRIAALQLGNPRRRLPSWYETLPLGLFYDESPHFFYLLHRLSGGELFLRHAHGVAGQKGEATPSLVHLLYRGAGGIPVTIDCQFDSALSEWYLRVTGDKATALVDIFRDIYIRLPDDGAHGALRIARTSFCAMAQELKGYLPSGLAWLTRRLDYGNDEIYARFANAIRTNAPPSPIDAQTALAVFKLQSEAIEEIRKNLFP